MTLGVATGSGHAETSLPRVECWPEQHIGKSRGSTDHTARTRVIRSEATMSKLARALMLAAAVAMNLTAMTAVAQTNDQDATSQRELAENWRHYQQATRVPPAELRARMQADAAERALSERWTYYYHATRMSPAELRAWVQPQDGADTPTEPPAPVRPAEPSGQPDWLVVSLGVLSAALALVAGLAVSAARRANRRLRAGHAA
jgi:hypothetical protein